MTHVMALEAGRSSQGTFEPITPVLIESQIRLKCRVPKVPYCRVPPSPGPLTLLYQLAIHILLKLFGDPAKIGLNASNYIFSHYI